MYCVSSTGHEEWVQPCPRGDASYTRYAPTQLLIIRKQTKRPMRMEPKHWHIS